jgi:tRNA(fMet)-specific endonuclease VapC
MKYLLDTNTCIQYVNGRSRSIAARLEGLDEGEAAICAVVVGEMLFGALRSRNVTETIKGQRQFFENFESLPFDDEAAEHYARIRADLTKRGTLIGANDLLIAAIALSNNLILVTHNTREFARVAELKLEDWEDASEAPPI